MTGLRSRNRLPRQVCTRSSSGYWGGRSQARSSEATPHGISSRDLAYDAGPVSAQLLPTLTPDRATMRTSKRRRWTQVALSCVIAIAAFSVSDPPEAEAFCGFYVAGADSKLYNNATMVVLMRDGQRTVLSMQNNYQGPAS